MQNTLEHRKEFERLLKNYKPNIEVIDILNQVDLVLLVAPAAAGRNTIIRNLIMTGRYYYIVSDTTRRPRINNGILEKNGNEYWFRTEEEFLDGLRRGAYVEASVIHNQQVSGMSLAEIRIAAEHHKIGITDITISGSDYMQNYKPDAHCIFVLPPAFDEWMRRLDGRGAIDPDEKHRRLQSAIIEISEALKRPYFKFMINWDLRATCEQLHEYVVSRIYDEAQLSAARAHASELLDSLHRSIG